MADINKAHAKLTLHQWFIESFGVRRLKLRGGLMPCEHLQNLDIRARQIHLNQLYRMPD